MNKLFFYYFSDVAGALRAPDLAYALRMLQERYKGSREITADDLTELNPEGYAEILVEITI